MRRRRDIRKEAERLTTGQINRRRFVMSALATGVTLPTAMSLATKAEALVPKRGGHLRIALPAGRAFDAALAFATGNGLTERDETGATIGELARDFGTDDGGQTWVFDLHRDVTMTDGRPLTAEGVAQSLLRADPALLPGLRDITATDTHQVTLRLDHADMTLPERLADPRFVITRLAKDGSLIGTGGYVVESRDSGALHLVRRADYWKPGRAHLDAVSLSKATDMATLQADVMAGRIDYAGGIPPEMTAFLAHLPDIQLARYEATRALVVHTGPDAPTGINGIRALRAGIDRDAFVERALFGHGRPGDDLPLPPAPDRHARTSPAAAPPEGPVTLSAEAPLPWLPHLADMAARAGIALHQTLDPRTGTLTATSFDADSFAHWATGAAMAGEIFAHDTAACARVAAGLSAARALEDSTARREEMAHACRGFAQDGGLFVPAWADDLAAHTARLARPAQTTPHLPNDGHRLIERWWFA